MQDYVDRKGIEYDIFERDWAACTSKARFHRMLAPWAKTAEQVRRLPSGCAHMGGQGPAALALLHWPQLLMGT